MYRTIYLLHLNSVKIKKTFCDDDFFVVFLSDNTPRKKSLSIFESPHTLRKFERWGHCCSALECSNTY
jgi:hypothetical protein